MGEMADFINEVHEQECADFEDYLDGTMHLDDAYDRGIIDEFGAAINHAAYARHSHAAILQRRANLMKPNPTCNCCSNQMQPRMGRYGKFYFCECDTQKAVSDKYWQSIRTRS